MTLDDLQKTIREMKEAEEKTAKVVVFHDRADIQRVIRNLPSTSKPEDFPPFVVNPDLTKAGTVLFVADRGIADAILELDRKNQEKQP